MELLRPATLPRPTSDNLDKFSNKLDKCGKYIAISCVICCVLSVILVFAFGLKIKKDLDNIPKTEKITGIVIENNGCRTITENTGSKYNRSYKTRYDCNLVVAYEYNNKKYIQMLSTNDIDYKVNSKISILVNSNNPENILYENQINSDKKAVTGLFVAGGILILLIVVHIVLYNKWSWYKKILCAKVISDFIF